VPYSLSPSLPLRGYGVPGTGSRYRAGARMAICGVLFGAIAPIATEAEMMFSSNRCAFVPVAISSYVKEAGATRSSRREAARMSPRMANALKQLIGTASALKNAGVVLLGGGFRNRSSWGVSPPGAYCIQPEQMSLKQRGLGLKPPLYFNLEQSSDAS